MKRFDGVTGNLIDNFASGGGIDEPNGIAFGPDGSLYVSSRATNDVKQFDGISGAFIGTFT
ncbi:MAG: hypothetical protein KDA37_13370 [Planctomycetales bacterium]|nr:hypothetical protein [Planctomycetales bacterium]